MVGFTADGSWIHKSYPRPPDRQPDERDESFDTFENPSTFPSHQK